MYRGNSLEVGFSRQLTATTRIEMDDGEPYKVTRCDTCGGELQRSDPDGSNAQGLGRAYFITTLFGKHYHKKCKP